jgi:hypothetical protein
VYIEATREDTENRLLKGLRKVCPDLSPQASLVDSLAAIRTGRVLRSGQKVLLVLDQFEQWLHAKRAEENTELVKALRQCDGERVQAIVMVRDDFWLAVNRFMADLEIELIQGSNTALIDLFDPRHARKVLAAFGTAYGSLPERTGDISKDQHAFLDQATSELAQDGKIISVRLALFAEMVKGKPWTPTTLREVGGTEGVGVTFLEETFGSPPANPKHHVHKRAAQAVLKALLPDTGTDIKGQMRSEVELQQVAAYADRPREFAELIHILDPELRLITPTDPEGSSDGSQQTPLSGQFYQLSHDYLVHSLRDWLTRKQRETRRGRAELRLAERSSLWNSKPENRHLPFALEWANIRLLTTRKHWTEPQRRMMRRAGRVYGVRGVLTLVLLVGAVLAGTAVYRQVIENQQAIQAASLVQRLLDAETPRVPAIVGAMRYYRRWVDASLRNELDEASAGSRQKLHASLALLPVDATLVDYLFDRLSRATSSELPVLRDALKSHRTSLTARLWTVLESAKPGDASLLPCASALASYDPESTKWEAASGKVAQALVSVDAIVLGLWIEALRPVRDKLMAPLTSIFQDKEHSESEHKLATNILANYASDKPDRLAELLMVSDPKAYVSLFPVAEKWTEKVLPIFQAELGKKATFSWDDPPLDPSWTKPDVSFVSRIEAAQGVMKERFAFCQTMPLDEFLTTAEGLRRSGYRPTRVRPYADGQVQRVAAVWTRDARSWRISSGLTSDEVRQQDERNKKDRFLPVDVAGYVTTDPGSKSIDRYAAIWVEKTGDDDVRMFAGITADQEIENQDKLRDEKLIPRTLHAMIGSNGRTRNCGVWGRPPETAHTGQTHQDQFEGNFGQKQSEMSDQLLIDVAVSGAVKPWTIRDRVQAALESADDKLKKTPDDQDARLARSMANVRLGENQKALDDLQVVIGKNPESVPAKQYRIIALARLGKKQDALTELAKFQREDTLESSKLFLVAVVAAELGEGAERELEALEAAIRKQPKDSDLRYDAARSFSLGSTVISRSDKARGRQLVERSLQLLRAAVKDGDADFGKMDEDGDLDAIRDDPAFADIMKAGHPERRYAAVWSSDAASRRSRSTESILPPICRNAGN